MREKQKVLVVDDDRRMVRTICDILRVKGYEALPAYSGEEAVNKAKDVGPDCVLMDIKMHGIDGVAALKMIKEISPDTSVLLMSANASEEQVTEAKQNGAAAVLSKPIEVDTLIRIIENLRCRKRIATETSDLLVASPPPSGRLQP